MNIEKYIEINCMGCGGCTCICPQKAVTLQKNQDGFFSATVDYALCNHCGLCVKVCPCNKEIKSGNLMTEGSVYAVRIRDREKLQMCSSGGVAYAMYQRAIKDLFYIVGTVYDTQKCIAVGEMANQAETIESFKGSKYIQCDFQKAFNDSVQKAMECPDARFLVIAMPCQIAGLHFVLEKKKIRDQFVLVDMFCHGVPSYFVWDEYCRRIQQKYGRLPENVHFRSKKHGWGTFTLEYDVGKRHIQSPGGRDFFVTTFFDDILLNHSCNDCIYRQSISLADIRIGDFWGSRFRADTEGVSAVLILTSKGADFFQSIQDVLEVVGSFDIHECLNAQSITPYRDDAIKKIAFDSLRRGESVANVVKAYRKSFSKKRTRKRKVKYILSYLPDGGRKVSRFLGNLAKMKNRRE